MTVSTTSNPAATSSSARTTADAKRPRGNAPFFARVSRNLIWGTAAVLTVIAATEALFAAAHIGEEEFVDIKPVIGFWHLPDKLVTWRKEGYSRSVTNSDGMRDVEFTVAKPAGVKRIAVFGDSMTEGYQVESDQTFAKLLEKRYQDAGQKVQVLNFGMSGMSTAQALYLFKEKIARYQPDLCVLAYHVGDNEKNVYEPSADSYMPRPYCQLDANGVLQTDWRSYDAWMRTKYEPFQNASWLRANSRIYGLSTALDLQLSDLQWYRQLKSDLGKVLDKSGAQAASANPRITDTANELSMPAAKFDSAFTQLKSFTVAATPLPDDMPSKQRKEITNTREIATGWRAILHNSNQRFAVTGAIIDMLNRACADIDCKLAVAALPAPNNSLLYFRELRLMKMLAQQSGFQYIDVNAAFPQLAPMQQSKLYYNIHFTPPGHELVADTLYKNLAGVVGEQ